MVVFNLDLNNKITPSPYSYEIPSSTQKIHFRLIQNDYPINYDNFRNLSLVMRWNNYTNRDSTSTIVTIGREKFIEYSLDSSDINRGKEVYIDPIVTMTSGTFHVGSIRLVMYDSSESSCRHAEWDMFNNVMDNFNMTLGKYYNVIKRDQINQPNGVIGLDSNGDIPLQYFPTTFTNHITDKLIDTKTKTFYDNNGVNIGIHGMKLDDKWRLIYYDSDDLEWYIANLIHGGNLVNPQKPPEWNIYGGIIVPPTINAMTFKDTLNDYMDGGTFTDKNNNAIDANFIDAGNIKDDNSIFGGTIT